MTNIRRESVRFVTPCANVVGGEVRLYQRGVERGEPHERVLLHPIGRSTTLLVADTVSQCKFHRAQTCSPRMDGTLPLRLSLAIPCHVLLMPCRRIARHPLHDFAASGRYAKTQTSA